MRLDRRAQRARVRALQVHGVAVLLDPRTTDVDQQSAELRRGARNRERLVDAVGALGAGVEPCRDAVGEHHSRPIAGAGRVRMNVDQPRHDELAARIDRRGCRACNAGFHRRDPPRCDRHVADAVEMQRRIDHATALDHEVVRRCGGERARPERGGCGTGRGHRAKLTSIQHEPPPSSSSRRWCCVAAARVNTRAARCSESSSAGESVGYYVWLRRGGP